MRWARRTARAVNLLLADKGPLIWDKFLTDLTAGNIDGAPAEPGPGTRSTGATASISGGNYVLSGAADDSLWYDEVVTRSAGQVAIFTPTSNNAALFMTMGFDTDQTPNVLESALAIQSDKFRLFNGGSSVIVGDAADGVMYTIAVILAEEGALFLEGGNFLGRYGSSVTSPLYCGFGNITAAGTIGSIQVPSTLWLLSPYVSDGHSSAAVGGIYYSDGLGHAETTGVGSGGDAVDWTGPTWYNSGGDAYNAPTPGAELLTNGGFDTDTDWTKGTGWTIGSGVAANSGVSGQTVSQVVSHDIGAWHQMSFDYVSGTQILKMISDGSVRDISYLSSGTYEQVFRASSASSSIGLRTSSAVSSTSDNISLKEIPTADLFRLTDHSTPWVYATAKWTIASGTQAGVAVCVDSATDPQNEIIAYHDGNATFYVEKCVAETYTTLYSGAQTYGADYETVVRTRPLDVGFSLWVWYNNAFVYSGTITDGELSGNTLHGPFVTSSLNALSAVNIYPATGHVLPGTVAEVPQAFPDWETNENNVSTFLTAVDDLSPTGQGESASTFGSLSGTAKWIGGVLAPNGYIYGLPMSSTEVLKIDPSDDSTSVFGSLSGTAKWHGGVLAPNGCIYGIPYNSTTILKIDPSDDSTSVFGSLSGNNKWFGGVLASNGYIYGVPRESTAVLKIDPSDDSVSTFGSLGTGNKWFGGVLAPNGCIYGIPYDSTEVLKIDPSDDSTSVFGSLSGTAKWYGGVLAPNGCIYGIPYNSTTILKIDPSDDSVSTFGSLSGTSKWAGGVLVSGGHVYGISRDSTAVLRILGSYEVDENFPLARAVNKF